MPFLVDKLTTRVMKRLALIPVFFVLFLGACERHDFEDTRRLHEHHGAHDDHSESQDSHH